MKRDFQRTKVYRAEAHLRHMEHVRQDVYDRLCEIHDVESGPVAPVPLSGRQLESPVHAQALVDRVIRDHPEALPDKITFRVDGRRTRRAAAGQWRPGVYQIRYPKPPWGAFFGCTLLLLHEIAHCFDPYDHHGPTYCAFYLHLVRTYISDEAADELIRQFKIAGVKVARFADKGEEK
jgi:putative metallohydrolase (TIGR04338 family)